MKRTSAHALDDVSYNTHPHKRTSVVNIEIDARCQRWIKSFKLNANTFKSPDDWYFMNKADERALIERYTREEDDMLEVYAFKAPPSVDQFVPPRISTFPQLANFPREVLRHILTIDEEMCQHNYAHDLLLTGDRRMRCLLADSNKAFVHVFSTSCIPALQKNDDYRSMEFCLSGASVRLDLKNGTALAHLTSSKGAWHTGLSRLCIGADSADFYFLTQANYSGIIKSIYRNRLTLVEIDISGPLHTLFMPHFQCELLTRERLYAMYAEDFPLLRKLGMACPELYLDPDDTSYLTLPPTVTHLKLYSVGESRNFSQLIVPYLRQCNNIQTLELVMQWKNVDACINDRENDWRASIKGDNIHLEKLVLHLNNASVRHFHRPPGPMVAVKKTKETVSHFKSGPNRGQIRGVIKEMIYEQQPSHPAGPIEFALLLETERIAIQALATTFDCKHVTWILQEGLEPTNTLHMLRMYNLKDRPWRR